MTTWFEQFVTDVRVGARGLWKTPGFTAVAVLSLAIGIMGTTAIYSVLHAVVLDPFPYKDVDRLMSVRVSNAAARGSRTSYSVDQFLEIAERSTIFDGVIASTISDVLWTGDGDPQRLRGNHGTFNTFDVMGVPPLLGRTPVADDAKPGAAPVVVLGYRFWQRQFGGDPNVLGRELRLNEISRTVIGIMPKRFMWRGADVYIPIRFERGRVIEEVRNVHLLGRLKPGVTDAQAEADLRPIIQDLKTREPQQFPDQWRVGLLSFSETFPSGIRGDIWVLFGAVAFLMVIACANVSNLLLSRATTRQREMTVRAALGAARNRLVRQLLTESLLLAIAAGVVGTALAYAALPAILSIVPPGTIPDEAEVALSSPVLLFTLAVCVVISVACGLAPALHSCRRDVASSLRESSRGVAGQASQGRLRNVLVVVEVALCLMLLSGTSLLVRTFVALQQVELGVAPDHLLTMRVPLAPQRYPDAQKRNTFVREVLDRVRTVPGVIAAGVNTGLHPLGNLWADVDVAGEPRLATPVMVHQVDSGYTSAVGARLIAGRLLTDTDVVSGRHVAVVNDRFARERSSGRSPIGRTIAIPRMGQPPFGLTDTHFEIVGVTEDLPNRDIGEPIMAEVYVPFTLLGRANVFVVRTQANAGSVTRSVVSQVYAVDPNQPVMNVETLAMLLHEYSYATPRFNLILLGLFAAIGLTLAIVGVYGVMSTIVAQQAHEIGVRLAVGANGGSIMRMVVARGSRLLIVGMVLGLIGSVVAARLLAKQVWNVPTFDPIALLAVSTVLLVAGVQACFWPALRAARIDPVIALRQE